MAQNEIWASGTKPQRADTKRVLWSKAVAAKGGTPQRTDTLRLLKGKMLKALDGLASNNTGM